MQGKPAFALNFKQFATTKKNKREKVRKILYSLDEYAYSVSCRPCKLSKATKCLGIYNVRPKIAVIFLYWQKEPKLSAKPPDTLR